MLNKFSQAIPLEMYEKQCAENACWYWGLKGGLTEGGRVEANGKTEENSVYYMAESASVQDEANPAF